MEKCVKLTLVICIIFFCLKGHGQNEIFADSLSYYANQKNFIQYYKYVKKLNDSAFAEKDIKMIEYLSKLIQNPNDSLNDDQKYQLRITSAYVGQSINKLTGNIDWALQTYLIGHKNVADITYLDTWAWYIENQIWNFYTMKGDYDKSAYYASLVERSLKHFKKLELLSRFYTNLGRQKKSELLIKEAIQLFETGLSLADSIQYSTGIYANSINLAEVYNEHPSLGSASHFLEIAETQLPKLSEDPQYKKRLSEHAIETANHLYVLGQYQASIPHYLRAIELLKSYHINTNRREFSKYYISLARAYLKADSLERCREVIGLGLSSLIPEFEKSDTLPGEVQLYAENSFIDLLQLLSQTYELDYHANGDITYQKKAIHCIEKALSVNEKIIETVVVDHSKLISIKLNKELTNRAVELVYELYVNNPSEENFRIARNIFNQTKSLLYGEKTRKVRIADLMSVEDRVEMNELQSEILKLHESKFNGDADIALINGQILQLEEALDILLTSYSDSLLVYETPSHYIEYCVTDSSVYAMTDLNDMHSFLKIGSIHELEALFARLDKYIELRGLSMDNSLLRDLFDYLIAPLNLTLSGPVTIIPDGYIGYIPFEMLKDEEGDYLITKCAISYSFEFVSVRANSYVTPKQISIYCLAPQYTSEVTKVEEEIRGSLNPLPYARMEVDSILRLFGSAVYISESSNKKDWVDRLSNATVFHYAGHAVIKDHKGYLALTDQSDLRQQVTGREISHMHIPVDLVVLSACETGLGALENGEGIISLGRNFMESGAASGIFSLWNVNDKSTAIIMNEFYKRIKSGQRKDQALREAKLEYLRSASVRASHPYFWSAFIPVGNMKSLL